MAKRLFFFAIDDSTEPEYFGKILDEHNIEHYIVPGSAFGFSKPAFWVKNDEDFPKAQTLFKQHEEEFARLAREKYQKETGYNPNANRNEKFIFWINYLKARPFNVLGAIAGLGLIIWYFSSFINMFSK